jgi:hypothetical protein
MRHSPCDCQGGGRGFESRRPLRRSRRSGPVRAGLSGSSGRQKVPGVPSGSRLVHDFVTDLARFWALQGHWPQAPGNRQDPHGPDRVPGLPPRLDAGLVTIVYEGSLIRLRGLHEQFEFALDLIVRGLEPYNGPIIEVLRAGPLSHGGRLRVQG